MRLHARVSLLALICALIAVLAPAAAQAAEEPGIATFVAVNCKIEECAQQHEIEVEIGAPFGKQKYMNR